MVVWAESHDTFADGTTRNTEEVAINKAWALIAARSEVMGLYLARPANFSQLLGAASNTAWAYPEVAEVNKFHNAFAGTSEYVANENGIAYVERGDSGVVLVNCKGTGAEVSVTANTMKDGTYTDQVTGNSFTVSGGKISGTIGDTGIAIVYAAEACPHAEHNLDGFCTVCSANVGHEYDEERTCSCGDVLVSERTIYFNSPGIWQSVSFYSWYDDINIITGTWPGNPMTLVEGPVYSCVVPSDAPNIIFNNSGDGVQTEDLVVPPEEEGLNMYDFNTSTWITYTPGESGSQDATEDTTPTNDTTEAAQPSTEPVNNDNSGSSAGLWIAIAAGAVVVVAIVVALIIKKKN
jgi:hypothetical protein